MTPAATPEAGDQVDSPDAVRIGVTSAAPAAGAQLASAVRDPGSYRDPSGFVFRRDGVVLRQIQASFADDWDAFIGSGLYERLRSDGLVIAHEVVSSDLAAAPGAYRVIRPEPIDFISYPYEWSFSQLQDAALLTLRLQELAVPAGMSLRDASAYNIQFQAGRPVLIDSLSFERLEPGQPWVAYRQFCEHFLAPLALMARIDIRLGQLLRANLEGVPLDLAARLLPGRTRFSMGLGPHIHLHARAQRRHADDGRDVGTGQGSKAGGTGMTASRLATLVESLRDTVRGLAWRPEGTEWADYADNTSYDRDATAAKEAAVSTALEAVRGTRAWDLGANTGRYSRLAADRGYRVVSLDVDPAAVERHYQAVRKDGRKDILPLVSDLRDPSPARGWASTERASLLDRADADISLALALVHHLAIGSNVPLPKVADLLGRVAPHTVVEWVPKEDAMVRRLLASRPDIFPDYTIEGLRAAFASGWDLLSETPIEGSQRTLFHFRRH